MCQPPKSPPHHPQEDEHENPKAEWPKVGWFLYVFVKANFGNKKKSSGICKPVRQCVAVLPSWAPSAAFEPHAKRIRIHQDQNHRHMITTSMLFSWELMLCDCEELVDPDVAPNVSILFAEKHLEIRAVFDLLFFPRPFGALTKSKISPGVIPNSLGNNSSKEDLRTHLCCHLCCSYSASINGSSKENQRTMNKLHAESAKLPHCHF